MCTQLKQISYITDFSRIKILKMYIQKNITLVFTFRFISRKFFLRNFPQCRERNDFHDWCAAYNEDNFHIDYRSTYCTGFNSLPLPIHMCTLYRISRILSLTHLRLRSDNFLYFQHSKNPLINKCKLEFLKIFICSEAACS